MTCFCKNQNDELCRPSLSVEERLLLIGCDESAKKLKIVVRAFFQSFTNFVAQD